MSQLPFSLEDNYKESGSVVWSPIGRAFIYEQHRLDNIGIHYAHDLFGISVDNTGDGKMLNEDVVYFKGCTWSPDGSYIGCSYNLPRATSGWCVMVYDARSWKWLCGVGQRCYDISDSYCGALSLGNGKLWYPAELDPAKMPIPEPTEVIHSTLQAKLTQFCQPPESLSRCPTSASPDDHFVTYGLRLDRPVHNDVILDKGQNRVWKIGVDTQFWSWSADSRYFSWIDNDQMRLFDTVDHTVTTYILPGAKILNVAWSPLK